MTRRARLLLDALEDGCTTRAEFYGLPLTPTPLVEETSGQLSLGVAA